ncbi:MAG: SDR family NAD(P)-dependent oxidoreductase [Acetobacteraceae bacterium]|nr:SDR family NAD(P)-dependent oxidoreductase [Acetobacteraceae bacterium]
MKVRDQVVVVTGGAQGIGRALCDRFRREGARAVVVVDLKETAAEQAARELGGIAFGCDVRIEAELRRVIEETEKRAGPIGLFCSNAGIFPGGVDPDQAASGANESWNQAWTLNVMAHVYAARALVPRMVARGGGYFLNTVSAAGLLSQIGNSIYSTTKHAAVGFAESLAITHRDQGIRVSILCPQGVETPMLRDIGGGARLYAAQDGELRPLDSRHGEATA